MGRAGTHRYDKFVRPSELARWMRGQRLQVWTAQALYNPLTQTFGIHATDTDVNYLMSARSAG